jgi:hypothetical protein
MVGWLVGYPPTCVAGTAVLLHLVWSPGFLSRSKLVCFVPNYVKNRKTTRERNKNFKKGTFLWEASNIRFLKELLLLGLSDGARTDLNYAEIVVS